MLDRFLDIALDLGRSRPGPEVYDRLVAALPRVVRADAAALLRWDGEALVPVALSGLSPQILGRRFPVAEHPRLAALVAASGPVRFDADDPRPDPYDGLVEGAVDGLSHVHSCMGCPLTVEGELVGALTLDALEPGRFDAVPDEAIALFAALAATAMRMAGLFEALQDELQRREEVARTLVRDALQRDGGELVGTSLPMQRLRREVEAAAQAGVTTLIMGETGTGKELVARTLHARSPRADKPLVYVNCAALPEGLAESEFFGHVRGAFTGASNARSGKFELADGGTIFLDEVGELPLTIQPKLLRALQEGELQRVGADRVRRVDVRVIAATNRDLEREVATGRFRGDLYHRLSVFPLHVPPLRARGDDVVQLAGVFLERARVHLGLRVARLTDGALDCMRSYDWPGNVRELQHVVLRATIRAAHGAGGDEVVVRADHLDTCAVGHVHGRDADAPAIAPGRAPAPALDFQAAVNAYQAQLIRDAVAAEDENWAAAARRLGLDRSNLHRMARRLGLK